MEFTYSFVVNSRPIHNGTIRLPLVNGMVKFGQFRPEEILNKNNHATCVVVSFSEDFVTNKGKCGVLALVPQR